MEEKRTKGFKKKAKRVLSFALAFCVMATGVPATAFAQTEEKAVSGLIAHYDFKELSDNVPNGTTIKDVSGSNHDAVARGNKLTAKDSILAFPRKLWKWGRLC